MPPTVKDEAAEMLNAMKGLKDGTNAMEKNFIHLLEEDFQYTDKNKKEWKIGKKGDAEKGVYGIGEIFNQEEFLWKPFREASRNPQQHFQAYCLSRGITEEEIIKLTDPKLYENKDLPENKEFIEKLRSWKKDYLAMVIEKDMDKISDMYVNIAKTMENDWDKFQNIYPDDATLIKENPAFFLKYHGSHSWYEQSIDQENPNATEESKQVVAMVNEKLKKEGRKYNFGSMKAPLDVIARIHNTFSLPIERNGMFDEMDPGNMGRKVIDDVICAYKEDQIKAKESKATKEDWLSYMPDTTNKYIGKINKYTNLSDQDYLDGTEKLHNKKWHNEVKNHKAEKDNWVISDGMPWDEEEVDSLFARCLGLYKNANDANVSKDKKKEKLYKDLMTDLGDKFYALNPLENGFVSAYKQWEKNYLIRQGKEIEKITQDLLKINPGDEEAARFRAAGIVNEYSAEYQKHESALGAILTGCIMDHPEIKGELDNIKGETAEEQKYIKFGKLSQYGHVICDDKGNFDKEHNKKYQDCLKNPMITKEEKEYGLKYSEQQNKILNFKDQALETLKNAKRRGHINSTDFKNLVNSLDSTKDKNTFPLKSEKQKNAEIAGFAEKYLSDKWDDRGTPQGQIRFQTALEVLTNLDEKRAQKLLDTLNKVRKQHKMPPINLPVEQEREVMEENQFVAKGELINYDGLLKADEPVKEKKSKTTGKVKNADKDKAAGKEKAAGKK